MRRTSIKPKYLHKVAKEFMIQYYNIERKYQVGRPREYKDSLILTILAIQNLYGFSFREVLEFCEDFFGKIPNLSTFHYRVKILKIEILEDFIKYLGDRIILSSDKKISSAIMDGTGFSYHDAYPMKYLRGLEVRKIRAHVKAEVLAGVIDKRRFIISANTGPPYASEIKLVRPLLKDLKEEKINVLGDKGYDCIDIIETILKKNCRPVIKMKETRRHAIKNKLRKLSKKNSSNYNIYKKRALIESLFGNIKQKLTSHVRIFNLDIARKFVLMRFALFNISVLVSLEKAQALWWWFSNSLCQYLTNNKQQIFVFSQLLNVNGQMSIK